MGILVPLLILLSGPLLGILLQRKFSAGSHKFIGSTVLFSGSFLLGIALFGLMPELFDNIRTAGLWIVSGFLFQIFLERYTGGLGHGHIHSHDIPKSVFVLFGGLMLHALFEGYSAGLNNHMRPGVISGMVGGIAIHEIPAAFSLSVLMHSKYKGKVHAILFLLFYACATPMGYFVGVFVHSENLISESLTQIITAIIAGTFLHISTTIVFENSLRKKEGLSKWIVILSGLTVSYIACLLG
ncbi:MAG: ZIP family metal transporter [Chitinophagaceae bacterium]